MCASGIANNVGKLIIAVQEANRYVGVVATPQGRGFIDAEEIEAQTGYPIRSDWRSPGDLRPLPPPPTPSLSPRPPSTRSTSGRRGISDTLALGILCEAYDFGIPTAVLEG